MPAPPPNFGAKDLGQYRQMGRGAVIAYFRKLAAKVGHPSDASGFERLTAFVSTPANALVWLRHVLHFITKKRHPFQTYPDGRRRLHLPRQSKTQPRRRLGHRHRRSPPSRQSNGHPRARLHHPSRRRLLRRRSTRIRSELSRYRRPAPQRREVAPRSKAAASPSAATTKCMPATTPTSRNSCPRSAS